LPDGKPGFICGFGIITIPSFTAENICEVKEALKNQDEYWLQQITV
jgi:hypothetical protein